MKESIISVLAKKEVEIDRDFEVTVEFQKGIGNLGVCQYCLIGKERVHL